MRIKKSYLTLIAFLLIMLSTTSTFADEHKLETLDINVFINEDGSAIIKERRLANLKEGTENYIIIGNLGKSEITDFKVFENGKQYEFKDNWNIDDSREEKVFKNGIINTSGGYELAWGIGEYGRHEYFLEYKVTNFIKELRDNQVLFWRFVNDKTNTPPENVSLVIESEVPFNEEQQKVWAFGYQGVVNFSDGKVIATSEKALDRSDYVTILLKLEKGLFATEDFIDKDFEEIKDDAFKGSDYNKDSGFKPTLIDKIAPILFGLFMPFIFIVMAISINAVNKKQQMGVFKRRFKEEYYRDYPYEGEILDIYYILFKMGLSSFNNILSGFVLKWINEDRIMTSSEEVGTFRKKEKTNINILNRSLPDNKLEGELYDMLLKASNGENTLKETQFIKWAKKNYKAITNWEENAKNESIDRLKSLGLLDIEEKKKFFFKSKEYHLTHRGYELEENIYKYVNYLHDYSLLNEHEAINVKIWDKIMIWAGFLGVTEVVAKQFENIYPNYTQESVYRGNSIYLANSLTRNISNAKTSAASSASSSGFGGSSSIGGGGGSFGGGSGGGTR